MYMGPYEGVSDAYKAAVQSSLDESSISASLFVEPDSFLADITYTGQEAPGGPMVNPWALLAEPVGMSDKFASFEDGRLKLDGTYIWPFADGEWWGAWFEPTQDIVITLEARQANTAPGVTIIFDDKAGEYASHVKVEVYGYGTSTIIDTIEVTDNDSPVLPIHYEMAGAGNIKVTVYADSWVGTHYVKVASVFGGLLYDFGGGDILAFEVTEEGTIFGSSLPSHQAVLTVDNSKGIFSVLSETSITKKLRQAMPVSTTITIAGDKQTFDWLLYEWSENQEEQSATFVSRPAIGFERRFTDKTGGTNIFYRIIDDVAEGNGLGWYPFSDPDHDWYHPWDTKNGNCYIGEDQQADSVLQELANCIGCLWDVTRKANEIVLVDDMFLANVRRIEQSVQFSAPQLVQQPTLRQIYVQFAFWDGTQLQPGTYGQRVNLEGEDFTLSVPNLPDSVAAQNLANAVEKYYKNAFTLSCTIKGDPALHPLQWVTVEAQDMATGGTKDVQVLLTKVQTTYSEDILQTYIEGVTTL